MLEPSSTPCCGPTARVSDLMFGGVESLGLYPEISLSLFFRTNVGCAERITPQLIHRWSVRLRECCASRLKKTEKYTTALSPRTNREIGTSYRKGKARKEVTFAHFPFEAAGSLG